MKSTIFSSIRKLTKGYYNDYINIYNRSSNHYSLPSYSSSNRVISFTDIGIATKLKFGRTFNSFNFKKYGIRLDRGSNMSDYNEWVCDNMIISQFNDTSQHDTLSEDKKL